MLELKNKKLCENCFKQIITSPCRYCGHSAESAVAPDYILLPGTVLEDKYVVGRLISETDYSLNYLAYSLADDCTVSVEEFYPKASALREAGSAEVKNISPDEVKGFAEEIQNAARFEKNPNITVATDSLYANNTAYAVSRSSDLVDLHTYVEKCGGKISTELAFFLLRELASALKSVHKDGIVHGNISDRTVFIDSNGKGLLGGFDAQRASMARNDFMPIENHSDEYEFGPWTDIYSIGAVIYWAVTGRTYPDPTKRLRQMEAVAINRDGVDGKLYSVLAKCMEVYPKRRYQNVDLLVRGIDEAMIKEEEQPKKEALKIDGTQPIIPNYIIPNEQGGGETVAAVPQKSRNGKVIGGIIAAIVAVALIATGIVLYFMPGRDKGGDVASVTDGDKVVDSTAETPELLYEKAVEYMESGSYEAAFDCFKMAAAKGHSDAAYEAGNCYYNGVGTEHNYQAAFNHYKLASDNGHTEALCMLGVCYFYGNGVDEDSETAVDCFFKAAENGSANAYYMLGECCYYGIYLPHSYEEALKYYEIAAEQNHGAALYSIANCYDYGLGVEQDSDKAVDYYVRAAEVGDPSALLYIGMLYMSAEESEEDKATAFEYLKKAADAGSVYGMYLVGECYESGYGVAVNQDSALEYYKKAAERGSGEGLNALGLYYLGKYDATKDADGAVAEKIVLYFVEAVDCGYTPAAMNVGDLLLKGFGNYEKDFDAAFECYELVCEEDYYAEFFEESVKKMRGIGEAYYYGLGVEKDYDKAFDYLSLLASDHEDSVSMNWVGYFYSNGYAVEQDFEQAFYWYKKSADAGCSLGMHNTAFCYANGKGTAKNQEKALEYYKMSAEGTIDDMYEIEEIIPE